MNHDETRYPEPDKFKPERWLSPDRPLQSFDEYVFPVFQGGPRICLGRDLALYEIKVLTVELLRRFRLEMAEKPEIYDDKWREYVIEVEGKSLVEPALTTIFRGDLNIRFYRRS